ncbi:MAG: winged helix-turn-helix transcriptional regulator [Saprospiraceae bacterium]|nr:winged helix-turn-helix transcriptional regulator [Saprospiraceae bacterium]
MYAKTAEFDAEQQQMAQYAKVLSHPARLAIVQLLARRQECIVGDIAQEFPFLSRTTVSQHLQELKNAGIISGEIDGVKICYCLNYDAIQAINAMFKSFFKNISEGSCCK